MGFFENFGLILVGILLVALSMGVLGVTFSATAGTISAGLQTAIMSLGFALIFTGIAGLFAPGAPEDGKQEGSEGQHTRMVSRMVLRHEDSAQPSGHRRERCSVRSEAIP